MKKTYIFINLLIAAGLILSACQATATSAPTSAPTATNLATVTNQPLPTATIETPAAETSTPSSVVETSPSATPAATTAQEKTEFTNWQGGYGFEATSDLWVGIKGRQSMLSSTVYATNYVIFGTYGDYAFVDPLQIANLMLETFFGDAGKSYKTDPSEPITIDGVEGQTIPFRGLLNSTSPVSGKIIIVQPDPTRYISVMGMANLKEDDSLWKTAGERTLAAILNSLTILPRESLVDMNKCSIAQDRYYGTSLGSPIKIGGGTVSGASRERAYMDNLLGTDNKEVTYEFVESKVNDGKTLDIYEVTSAGQRYRLFFDENELGQILTPYGFNCRGAFPFGNEDK